MKTLDGFLLKDILKNFRKAEVAFYIDDIQPYNKAMASIRMRCYDIIPFLEKNGIKAELFKPYKNYQVVIFTKTISDKSIRVARKLKQQGVKIYFESYCDYLDDDSMQNHEKENILRMLKLADIAGVSSDVQKMIFSKYHHNVVMIPESVHDDFFADRKKHTAGEQVRLVYCGYSNKAKDTLCIKNVILKLQQEYQCKMVYICEKDPQIQGLKYEYVHYDQKQIPQLLMKGDIMVAPRPMEGIEKRAHSFTKAAYPLAVGLPTVASPMPSYIGTPVILCNTEDEWYDTLKGLIENVEKRNEIGKNGQQYVYENYSIEVIGARYINLVKQLENS